MYPQIQERRYFIMKSIAFYNNKGGVGKTTSVINIAYQLATDKKILVVYMDGQSEPIENETDFDDIEESDEIEDEEDGVVSERENEVKAEKERAVPSEPKVFTINKKEAYSLLRFLNEWVTDNLDEDKPVVEIRDRLKSFLN